jgi:hypothetical protein
MDWTVYHMYRFQRLVLLGAHPFYDPYSPPHRFVLYDLGLIFVAKRYPARNANSCQ